MSTASSAPAAPRRWPVIDFVAVTAMPSVCSPNARLIALYSATSPTGVEVACALMWLMSLERQAGALDGAQVMARDAPEPFGSGAVMWWASADSPTPASSA